ncbi:MAG: tripartite tricarboxylate transporter substrate binding protein [Betaproteobacteria bacterium]|nr:tripartite tricarboxylate transporter substrate binding protein [Betaproteobacteria bacterium]
MKNLILLGLFLCTPLAAQEWSPSRPIRIVVPVLGGTNDLVARLVAPRLQDAVGQSVVVENKPGAGGNIGADLVAKAPPDGHTLLIGFNGPIAVNVTLFDRLPYDPLKDLAPITLAVTTPQFLAVHASVPANTVQELVALAKKSPGKLTYASIEIGSASHLTMEMMKSAAGVDILHVPHRGSAPAITAILGGQVDAGFFVPGNVLQHAKAGKLKLIAATGAKRFAAQPEVPTMIESGFKDFEATAWIGFLAPGGTPRPVIDRLHREITRILRTPEVSDKLLGVNFEMVASTPEQFDAWIRKEIPLWAKVIKQTGAKAGQ